MTRRHFSTFAGLFGLAAALLLAPAALHAAIQQQGPNREEHTTRPQENRANHQAQKPANRPAPHPAARPNSRPAQPAARPSHPTSRPVNRPNRPPRSHPNLPSSQRNYTFRSQDISRLRNQYRSNYSHINRGSRPRFYRGGYIPLSYRHYFQPVPPGIIGYLPPVPPGYAVGYYDGYVVVYSLSTFAILNLIDLLTQ